MTITITKLKSMSSTEIKNLVEKGNIVITSASKPMFEITKLAPNVPPTPATKLYRAPQQVDNYVNQYPDFKRLQQPSAVWIGSWSGNFTEAARRVTDAAKAAGAVPSFAFYMIPGRDMGGFSAGGAKSPDEYKRLVDDFARGLTTESIIILEPDALVHDTSPERVELLRYAIIALRNHRVYVDAGHPRWNSAEETASRLHTLGLANATGFALNTSNFVTTDLCVAYGKQVSAKVGNKHFVIDTSRNGNSDMPETWDWANPDKARVGRVPTLSTGEALVDGYLWVKTPGESDGQGGIDASPAGEFRPKLALSLLGKL